MDFKKLPGEEVIWHGGPEFKPYFESGLTEFLSIFKFFVFTWTLFIVLSKVGRNELNWTAMYFIALTMLGSGLYTLLKKLIIYKETAYFITNLRVVIKKGSAKESITLLERSKITFLDLEVSKTELKFNVGTILIHLGEVKDNDGKEEKVFYKLESVREPKKILKLF